MPYNVLSYILSTGKASVMQHHYSVQLILSLNGALSCSVDGAEVASCTGIIINQNIAYSGCNATALVCFVDPRSHAGARLSARLCGRAYEPLHEPPPLPAGYESLNNAALKPYVFSLIDRLAGGASTRLKHKESIDTICTHIALHLTEHISLAALAVAVHLSPERTRRVFEEGTGITLTQYILWQRIKAVLDAVQHGSSFYDAINKYGFTDHSHFSRIFKRIFGMGPKQMVRDCRILTL